MKSKRQKATPPATLFGVLTLLNYPLTVLAALVLYVQAAGEISSNKPFAWFVVFEDFFNLDYLRMDLVLGLLAVIVLVNLAAYLLSFLPRFARRPFVWLMLLHGQIGILLAVNVLPFLTLSPIDLMGILGLGAVLLVLVVYPALAWLVERLTGKALSRQSLKYYQREEYGSAAPFLSIAARFQPHDLEIRRKLGLARFEIGDVLGAIDSLETLAEGKCTDAKVLEMLEECYRTERIWEKALDMGKKQLALTPENTEIRLRAAHVLDRLGKLGQATEILLEAPQTEDFEILEQLLAYQLKAGQIPAAIEVVHMIEQAEEGTQSRTHKGYHDVLEAAPDNHAALEGLGNFLIRHNKEAEGHACFEIIVSKDSQRHDLRTQLVHYYQQNEQLAKAEPHLEALMDAGRDTVDVALLYGDILYHREEYDRALLHFQYSVENYPRDYRFAFFLSQIHLKSGALEDANYWSEEALKRVESQENLEKEDAARVRALQTRVREALVEREMQVWQERCNRDPDNIDIRMNLVDALAGRGFIDKVIEECDILIANNPDHQALVIRQIENLTLDIEKNFRLLDYLADLKVKSHRWNEAFDLARRMAERSMDSDLLMTEHCRRILEGFPDHVPSLKCLGEITLKNKDWPKTLDVHDRLQKVEKPEDDRYLKTVFKAAMKSENREKAVEAGEALIEFDPLDMKVKLRIIRLYTDMDLDDKAERHLQAGLAIDYYNPEIVRLKSELELRRRNQRLEKLLADLQDNPADPEKQIEAGDLYMRRTELKKAISCFQHAARDPQYKNLAGAKQAYAMAKLHMFDLAEETVDEISLSFDDPCEAETAITLVYETAEMFEGEDEALRALNLYKKIFRVEADYREVVDKIDALKHLQ